MSRCIIRVFPRKTKATPDDHLAIVNRGPLSSDEADEVHISVAFDWDLRAAERLAQLWRPVAPVLIGGPATGEPGGEFVPGRYLREGYVITSRGCPNNCWFCAVPQREGDTPEAADKRMRQALDAGFTPMAMVYNLHDWKTFQRLWARPAIIYARLKSGLV